MRFAPRARCQHTACLPRHRSPVQTPQFAGAVSGSGYATVRPVYPTTTGYRVDRCAHSRVLRYVHCCRYGCVAFCVCYVLRFTLLRLHTLTVTFPVLFITHCTFSILRCNVWMRADVVHSRIATSVTFADWANISFAVRACCKLAGSWFTCYVRCHRSCRHGMFFGCVLALLLRCLRPHAVLCLAVSFSSFTFIFAPRCILVAASHTRRRARILLNIATPALPSLAGCCAFARRFMLHTAIYCLPLLFALPHIFALPHTSPRFPFATPSPVPVVFRTQFCVASGSPVSLSPRTLSACRVYHITRSTRCPLHAVY